MFAGTFKKQACAIMRTFSTSSMKLAGKNNEYSLSSTFMNLKKQGEALDSERQKQRESAVMQMFVNDFSKQSTYDPFDFSIANTRYHRKLQKIRKEEEMKQSSFNSEEVNPEIFYCMPQLLSKYLNNSGQIQHHTVTGLKTRKQKAMAKAVRRARAFGLLSPVARDVSMFPRRGSSL